MWTVNDVNWMKWAIRKGVDGVITDDPKKYLEVCDDYDGTKIRISWTQWGAIFWVNLLVAVFSVPFRFHYGFQVDVAKIRKGFEDSRTIAHA